MTLNLPVALMQYFSVLWDLSLALRCGMVLEGVLYLTPYCPEVESFFFYLVAKWSSSNQFHHSLLLFLKKQTIGVRHSDSYL
jgi:hypothetical protein